MTLDPTDNLPPECCPGAGTWFDRSICPEPCDTMHDRCTECGKAVDGCDHDEPTDRATFRDAATGQYVTAEHAATNPDTTVREDDSRARELQARLDAVVALVDAADARMGHTGDELIADLRAALGVES